MPHLRDFKDIFNFLNQFNSSFIWKSSPTCEEHESEICFVFKLNFCIAPDFAKGIAWNNLIADLGKIVSWSLFVEKIISSIKQKLKIIFCFGETLKQKKRNETNNVLKKQISEGLKNIKKIDNILFAYEPVWSIGTGVVPKISDLQIQMRILKKFISKKFKSKNPVLLYGGSVNQKNAILFKQINEIEGFLVGGASQNSNKFIDIIKKTII